MKPANSSGHWLRATDPRQNGFTLVELSVVLVVIGIILATLSVGRDVQRNAAYQRLVNEFIQGWAIAYESFYDGTGRPPGDSASSPTGMINGASNASLCGDALRTAMQAAGIAMPQGRAEGQETRYVYLDSNGNPQEAEVCFINTLWNEPGGTPGVYVAQARNVMRLAGLTPALANLLDSTVDGRIDSTFGRIREISQAAIPSPVSSAWSVDDRMAYGQTHVTARDENQVAIVTAYFRMSR